MDHVGRGGHDHGIHGIEDGQAEMREGILGTDGHDDVLPGVQEDVELTGVMPGEGLLERQDAAGRGVAVILHFAQRRMHGLDDGGEGRVGGIAHAEINHIHAAGAQFVVQDVQAGEDVGRQMFDAPGRGERQIGAVRLLPAVGGGAGSQGFAGREGYVLHEVIFLTFPNLQSRRP